MPRRLQIDEKNSLFGSISWSNTAKTSTPPFQGALDGGNFYGSSEQTWAATPNSLHANLESDHHLRNAHCFSRLVTARTQANASTDEFSAEGIAATIQPRP